MKKTTLTAVFIIVLLMASSCEKCAECHYDKDGQQIELGETCGKDEIKDLEANGKTIDSIKYDVHCSDH